MNYIIFIVIIKHIKYKKINLLTIPSEILLTILSFVKEKRLRNLKWVCSLFHVLINDGELWKFKHKWYNDFLTYPYKLKKFLNSCNNDDQNNDKIINEFLFESKKKIYVFCGDGFYYLDSVEIGHIPYIMDPDVYIMGPGGWTTQNYDVLMVENDQFIKFKTVDRMVYFFQGYDGYVSFSSINGDNNMLFGTNMYRHLFQNQFSTHTEIIYDFDGIITVKHCNQYGKIKKIEIVFDDKKYFNIKIFFSHTKSPRSLDKIF